MSILPAAVVSEAQSLVKYEHPVLLSKKEAYIKRKGLAKLSANPDAPDAASAHDRGTSSTLKVEVINSITAPRETTNGAQAWIQYVSSAPSTRQEVKSLQRNFDKRLQAEEARETAICPVREGLYAECIDELIRQEAVICAERGALMLRVRDERRHTIQALQVAYQSSLAYGVRHMFECERALNQMAMQAADLEQGNAKLRAEAEDLSATLADLVEEREISRRERAENFAAEIDEIKEEEKDLMEDLSGRLVAAKLKDPPPEEKKEDKDKPKS